MASRFETRFKAQALPLLKREFDQVVRLISVNGSELRFNALVDVNDIDTGEGFSDLQGTIAIKTTELKARIQDCEIGSWTTANVRGQVFDVYGRGPDQFGTTVFSIRRKHDEQQYTNLFDINGDQTLWQE